MKRRIQLQVRMAEQEKKLLFGVSSWSGENASSFVRRVIMKEIRELGFFSSDDPRLQEEEDKG